MSLKSLINALFKLSGGQAMPSSGHISLITSDITTTTQLVAPDDGYISILSSPSQSGSTGWIQLNGGNLISAASRYNTDQRTKLFIPVKKGSNITISLFSSTINEVWFCGLVGGG